MSDDVFLASYLHVWVNVTIGNQTIPLLADVIGATSVLWMTPDVAATGVVIRVDVQDPLGAQSSDTRTVSLTRQSSLALIIAVLIAVVLGIFLLFGFLRARRKPPQPVGPPPLPPLPPAILPPVGAAIMKLIDQAIRDEFDSTGHGEVNFPVLIPESEFKKEAEHVKGFEGDVFWVTRGGFNELDVKLDLRPTSQTAMSPMFKLWTPSHADLPLKVYQIVPVFRYETKMTRTFMRVREIHFFEAHTAHATFEDAEQQIHEDLQMNERVMRMLALPYIVSRRPDWDKFPGATYSLGTDTLLPSGRAAQVATFHQYRDNFAKVYDVT